MARNKGRGGNREAAPAKQTANVVAGGGLQAPPVNFDGGYGNDTATAPLQAVRRAPAPANLPPRSVMPLDAPDDQPDIPVTAGLPIGPGPGPEAFGPMELSPIDKLKRIYRLTGDPDILELLMLAEARG